jgi:uncharacterized protein (DUF433 family)
MDGVPCIRNLRIPVATIIQMTAEGMTTEKIIEALPDLNQEDIKEALEYAAASVQELSIPYTS